MTTKKVSTKWRESASLIILSIDKTLPKSATADYKVLLFNRSEKASSFAESSVFPGGVREAADESPLWLKYLSNFGCTAERLRDLTIVKGPRPSIFAKPKNNCIERELSLRITAIRETFEEVGIFFCRDRQSLQNSSPGYGHVKHDFDRAHWQQAVHNDPEQFLTLCQKLDVVPDLWSLQEWSTWMTPAVFPNRFETAFYMVPLQNTPELILEKNEVVSFAWKTPLDYLKAYINNELWLPPPQFYELSRLLNFTELATLKDFAIQRAQKGSTLILPVQYMCTDGHVAIMPGDDLYPSDPHLIEYRETNQTMEQFRTNVKKVHRAEYVDLNNGTMQINFELDGHRPPIKIQNHKASL